MSASQLRARSALAALVLGVAACLPRARVSDASTSDGAGRESSTDVLPSEELIVRDALEEAPPDVLIDAGLDAPLDAVADTSDDALDALDVFDVLSRDASRDAPSEGGVVSRCPMPRNPLIGAGTLRTGTLQHRRVRAGERFDTKSALLIDPQTVYVIGAFGGCATCTPSPGGGTRPCDPGVGFAPRSGGVLTARYETSDLQWHPVLSFSDGLYSEPGASCPLAAGPLDYTMVGRLDSQGRILLAGRRSESDRPVYDALVLRLWGALGARVTPPVPGATVDTTFGEAGAVRLRDRLPSSPMANTNVFDVLEHEGFVYAVGADTDEFAASGTLGFIAKLDEAGALVNSFGGVSNGVLVDRTVTGFAALAVEGSGADSRLLVLSKDDSNSGFRLTRVLASSGALDTSFNGGQGWAEVTIATGASPTAVLATDDGYYLFGDAGGTAHEAVVARLTPRGTVDRAFGVNGVRTLGIIWNRAYQFGAAVTRSCDGWIYVAGMTDGTGTTNVVRRFDPRGVVDTRYGTGGSAQIRVSELPTADTTLHAVGPSALLADPRDGAITLVMGTNVNNGPYLAVFEP